MRGKGQLGTITHAIRVRAPLLHRLSGTPAKLFISPTKVFFSLAGVRDEDVRVGSHTHEDIRVKANTRTCTSSTIAGGAITVDLFIKLILCPPNAGIRHGPVQSNHAPHSLTSTTTSLIGDDSQVRVLARLFASVHAQICTRRRRKHLRVDEQRDRW